MGISCAMSRPGSARDESNIAKTWLRDSRMLHGPSSASCAERISASSWCGSRTKSPTGHLAFRSANIYLKFGSQGRQNALEEAPEADSISSGEARQRSKPRKRISGFKGRAADSAMLERHARQDCSSRSTAGHETIPDRSLSQTRV